MARSLRLLALGSVFVTPTQQLRAEVEAVEPFLRRGKTSGGESILAEVASAVHGAGIGEKKEFSPLTLIHIPRNAGTTLEELSVNDGDNAWGHQNVKLNGQGQILAVTSEGKNSACSLQHVPPSMLPEFYNNKETFCVVRDPYRRMISIFTFPLTAEYQNMVKKGECNAKSLNDFVFLVQKQYQENPAIRDCHIMSQTSYLFKYNFTTNTADTSQQYCKHQLRMENLEEEFNALMAKHGYDRKVTSKASSVTRHDASDCDPLSPDDFSPDAVDAINEMWKPDFELLHYDMRPGTKKVL